MAAIAKAKPFEPNLRKVMNRRRLTIFGLLLPYLIGFSLFIVLPVIVSVVLSLTDFNSITWPSFVFLRNYITLLTDDPLFMQKIIPNTITFAIIAGPLGFFLAFFLAWLLAQISKVPRTIFALIIYSPSLVAGTAMSLVWKVIFSGDANGYLNSFLLNIGAIDEAIQWLQSPQYLMMIMIIVTVWSNMGVGFLAMLSGILNVDPQLYEAAYMDGMKSRFQEIMYVTIPSMKPQLLFGAVMSIVGTLQAGAIGVLLSGTNPTPLYSGQLIVNHIEDYGFLRYEMGYAAAISVILLLFIYFLSKLIWRLLGDNEDAAKRKKNKKRVWAVAQPDDAVIGEEDINV